MATQIVGGPRWGPCVRDREGHREYKLTYQVLSNTMSDGPAVVLQTPGLPVVGDFYVVPGTNEEDLWATCKLDANVKLVESPVGVKYDVEFSFSTKSDEKRCKDQQIDDPLLVPDEISGGFTKYQEEATVDRFGRPILNSSLEQIRGPQVEFDKNRPSVVIKQNRASLELELLNSMQDTLNDSPLWGMPARCIKLNIKSWSRKFYGLCYVYYQRELEFEIRKQEPGSQGFDRVLLDEGTKILNGHWSKNGKWILDDIDGFPPDRTDPSAYKRFQDRAGNVCKVILNGQGQPAGQKVDLPSSNFVSVDDDNIGNYPSSSSSWVSLTSTTPVAWSAIPGRYASGTPVTGSDGKTYLAVNDSEDEDPTDAQNQPVPWYLLPGGLTGGGAFDMTEYYDKGNWVTIPNSTVTQPGQIGVQKYGQSNFLLLGIPLTIG